jgi:hypothetical protein
MSSDGSARSIIIMRRCIPLPFREGAQASTSVRGQRFDLSSIAVSKHSESSAFVAL